MEIDKQEAIQAAYTMIKYISQFKNEEFKTKATVLIDSAIYFIMDMEREFRASQ